MITNQLLRPASIVVVGASNNVHKPGGAILRNLINGGYTGELRAVNPKETEVQGVTAYADVKDIPDTELAILAIPAQMCPDAVEVLAAEKQVRAFIILSAGFGEETHEGALLEDRILETVNKYGASLIGPNCIGLMNTWHHSVFSQPIPQLHPQGVDLISSSGATAVFILESAVTKGLQFNSVWSVGNAKQIGVEDVLQYMDENFQADKDSKIKLLYIESIGDPDRLLFHASSLIKKGCKIAAIKAGKAIALANKETLVVAGELITSLATEHKVPVLPVDSEHSAIFQCLAGEWENQVEKILLTASGGPFRTKTIEELAVVTKAQALKHPNWSMGAKITIDSASMMNKGFEMIEAKWLFGVTPEQIQIVVHPQSVIHSMVQFEDGAVMAQLGIPDMKLPISYAFSYPKRLTSKAPRLDFNLYSMLTFEEPDMTRFRNLAFAFDAIRTGGNMPCILNAANEVVVAAFLRDEIGFLQMSDVIEKTMATSSFIATPTYEDYVATDAEARRVAASVMNTIAGK